MNQIIVDAIETFKILQLHYHGYSRTVEPHTYGLDKNGVGKLRCYQIEGGSASGSPVDWKLLIVSEIRDINMTGGVFAGARHGYRKGDSAMRSIFAEL